MTALQCVAEAGLRGHMRYPLSSRPACMGVCPTSAKPGTGQHVGRPNDTMPPTAAVGCARLAAHRPAKPRSICTSPGMPPKAARSRTAITSVAASLACPEQSAGGLHNTAACVSHQVHLNKWCARHWVGAVAALSCLPADPPQ